MSIKLSYSDICKREIEHCQQRLTELDGSRIQERVGNGEWRDITEELKDDLKHTIETCEAILKVLDGKSE